MAGAGGFAAGLKPTGNKDPFALRRNALGLARSIIESGFELNLQALLVSANNQLAGKGVQADAHELYDFILDRLRGYYADKGVPASHFNAVAEWKPASLYDFDRRLDAIGTLRLSRNHRRQVGITTRRVHTHRLRRRCSAIRMRRKHPRHHLPAPIKLRSPAMHATDPRSWAAADDG